MDSGWSAATLYAVEDGVTMPTGGQLVPTASTGSLQPGGAKAVSGRPFKPGQSGNPAGRKPGSRNKLSELFAAAMRDDFAEHGQSAIAALRERDPAAYLAAIRSMIPAKVIAESVEKQPTANLNAMSDAEWAEAMDEDGNPHEQAIQQARRIKAVELVMTDRATTVWDAMRMLGADL